LSYKDAERVGTWDPSNTGAGLLSRTTGTENVTASVTFKVRAAKPGIYNAYMKSDHDTQCNRLNNVNVFITDKHGTKKKFVDQTDLHLNQKWYSLGQLYVHSTSTTHPALTITVTNAGGDRYDQLISVGNIKLVSQEMYKVPDVSFTEEQIALLRPIFETLDTNSDGVLTSAGLGSQAVGAFLESLGDQKNEAIALIQDYLYRFNGTINFDQFLEIVEEEFHEYFTLFSDIEGGIKIDDFVKILQSPDIHPLVSKLSSLSPEQQLRAALSSWDWDGDGTIRYREFVSAVLDSFLPDLD
jgi:Ca2+-binding EF-hand superfamily protein